jgi:hypothetical protein
MERDSVAPLPPDELDSIQLQSDATVQALAGIDETPFAFGEDVAEFIRYVYQIRTHLSRVHSQTHKHMSNLKISKENLEKVWIESRFKYMPSILSALDATEALLGLESTLPLRLSSHGRSRDSSSVEDSLHKLHGSETNYADFGRRTEFETSFHASILYEATNPTQSGWRGKLGLRAKDIPRTLWNIVPYSFMVDRVVDISSAIQGLVNLADPRISILAGSVTQRTTLREEVTLTGVGAADWNISVSSGVRESESFSYTRRPWTPRAGDAIPLPEFSRLVDAVTDVLDLASLISQRWHIKT